MATSYSIKSSWHFQTPIFLWQPSPMVFSHVPSSSVTFPRYLDLPICVTNWFLLTILLGTRSLCYYTFYFPSRLLQQSWPTLDIFPPNLRRAQCHQVIHVLSSNASPCCCSTIASPYGGNNSGDNTQSVTLSFSCVMCVPHHPFLPLVLCPIYVHVSSGLFHRAEHRSQLLARLGWKGESESPRESVQRDVYL